MPLIDKLKSKTVIKDGIRFLIGGGLNTAISYLAYLFFLLFTSYQIAYALSWVVGLLIIVIFYPSKVFVGSQNSWKKNCAINWSVCAGVFLWIRVLKSASGICRCI